MLISFLGEFFFFFPILVVRASFFLLCLCLYFVLFSHMRVMCSLSVFGKTCNLCNVLFERSRVEV